VEALTPPGLDAGTGALFGHEAGAGVEMGTVGLGLCIEALTPAICTEFGL
jgi:hypothetical protein